MHQKRIVVTQKYLKKGQETTLPYGSKSASKPSNPLHKECNNIACISYHVALVLRLPCSAHNNVPVLCKSTKGGKL